MPIFTDQMNRRVEITSTPKRIISLVPSQTELLFDLGLNEELVGLTKFCIHPADLVRQKVKVGGTKQLNIKVIKEIKPDLIIGNKEENEKEQVEELMGLYSVWMSDIADLDGALDMIKKVGELVGKGAEAREMAGSITRRFNNLQIKAAIGRVAYLIWRQPYIVAGSATFINDMLKRCGLTNAFDIQRYPEVTAEQIIEAKPDVVLLSSEPYPFKEKHLDEFRLMLPGAVLKLVDGELFSWYGSRLLGAPAYIENLINVLERTKL